LKGSKFQKTTKKTLRRKEKGRPKKWKGKRSREAHRDAKSDNPKGRKFPSQKPPAWGRGVSARKKAP